MAAFSGAVSGPCTGDGCRLGWILLEPGCDLLDSGLCCVLGAEFSRFGEETEGAGVVEDPRDVVSGGDRANGDKFDRFNRADGVSDKAVNEALPFWGCFDPEIRYSGSRRKPEPGLGGEGLCSVPSRTGIGVPGWCGCCAGGVHEVFSLTDAP